MVIVMEVMGIELMDKETSKGKAYKVTIIGKSSTIYDHQAYVKLNSEEIKGVAIGDKWAIAPLEAIDHRELGPGDVARLADMEHAGITDLDTREMDS